MRKIRFVKVDLKIDKALIGRDAEKLRGHIGQKFSDDINFHNHGQDGFRYGYPLVQYKVVDRKPILVGVEDGVESIWRVFREVDDIELDGDQIHLIEKSMVASEARFGGCETQVAYRFRTPWYPLSQSNYSKYSVLASEAHKVEFLEKILVGNILSMAKSLGIFVETKLQVANLSIRPKVFRLDDVRVLGFLGDFSVNFEVPDYLGLGRSVARGLGTVTRAPSPRGSGEHATNN